MKKYAFLFLCLVLRIYLFAQPTITSFTPASGPVGSQVTIKGTHFDAIPGNNIVYFGAVKATVVDGVDTILVVTVPVGATYQPITVTTNNLTAYSNKPFIVTFNGINGPFTSNSFLPKTDINLGQHPFAVAAGDFDGDGKADFLTPMGGADTVSVLRNTSSSGNISFAPKLNFPTTGKDNEECAVGDLDGDGKLDFVITNGTESHSFSVFRNTSTLGNISFAPKLDYPTNSLTYFVCISDLNGDGKPDIAAADHGSNVVSVYINTSTAANISFNPKINFPANANPYFITAGDLDSDGKQDLVVLTSGNVLSVMRNTTTGGNISFAANVNLATLTNWFFASISDLDDDGKPDIAATNGNSIAVLNNKSTPGNVSFNSPQNFATGNTAACISVTDLNGDGKPDMVVTNQASANVSILRNISTGGNISFDAHIDYAVGTGPFSSTIDDIDGDQRPDIITANSTVYTVSILKNAILTGNGPAISAFLPTSGVAGTEVKITGSNFTNVTWVSFGGVPASSFTIDSNTGITAIVGNGATGDVSVTTIFGTATLSGFTYNGPFLTSFTPSHGIGGTSVTIKGLNFTGATAVKFGGVQASSFTVDSSTGITAIVGAGLSGNVTVTTPNGTASLPGFIFDLPTITSFSPTSGPIGTSVTITGTHFDAIASHNIIYFGAVKAPVSSGTDSTLIVTAPSGATYQPITVTANNLTAYSSKPFTVTFTGAQDSFTSTSFVPKIDFTAGNYPHSVAPGDFDGDGKIDLLVSKGSSSVVTLFRNTTVGENISFAPISDFPAAGDSHEGCAIGDFDGDGKLDFAVANGNNSYTVSIYRNTSSTGNISFASKIDYPTGNSPYSVAIHDLNGDGKPDLVVANSGSDTISVYRNASTPGNISFDTKFDFYSGTNPYGISIGDLDGDGKPDLALTTQGGSSSLSVMRNISTEGNVSFATKIDLAILGGPFIVSVGDLDGDGKPDLAAASSNSNTIAVVRNVSTPGNIFFKPKVDFITGNYPVCVSISDLDGDAKPDLITSNRFSNNVSVLKNKSTTGNISFADHVDYAVNTDPFFVAAVDMDGDTRPDIISANSASNTISILRNIVGANVAPTISLFTPTFGLNGTVVKIIGTNFIGTTSVSFGGVPAASFTIDSSTGIAAILGSGATGNVSVTTKYGTTALAGFVYGLPPTITSFLPISGPVGTIVTIVGSHFDTIPSHNVVYFGAVKATISSGTDSTLIVMVPVGTTYQPITVTANSLTAYSDKPFNVTFASDGSPFTSTSFSLKIDFGSGIYPHSVASGDFDEDGKADLLVSRGSSGGTVTIFKNTSSPGNISFFPKLDFAAAGNNEGCAIGDLDGDGKLDFVVAGGNNLVSVHRNISIGGNISFASKINYPTGNGPYSVALGDLNGDGKPELVVSNNGSDIISIYKNLSTPGNILFDTKIDLSPGTNPYSVSIGDLDGDGKPDLAITTQGSSASLSAMRNVGIAGNISFSTNIHLATLGGSFIVSIADLDGDGKPDLATTRYNTVAVLRNLSTVGNITFDTTQNFATGNYVTCVSMGDLDGDGKPDLVTSNWLDNNISVLKNGSTVGNINFENQVLYAVDANPYYIAISDFDGDSKPDLVVANSSSDSVSILRNRIGEPQITAISVTTGGDGTNVIIAGKNFEEAAEVKFGGTAAKSFTVKSSAEVDAIVGGGASGNVTVTTHKGTGSIAGFRFIPDITAAGPLTFCRDSSVTLTSSALANNQWYKNNTAISGATAKTLLVNSNGAYLVKTTSNGTTTSSDSVMAIVITVPTPIIILDANNNLTSSAATGNQWYLNGNLILGATSQTYHPAQSGAYTVRDTLNNCLSNFSAAYNFIVTGIIDLGNNQYIKLYPNPVKNNLNINWNITGMPLLNTEISDIYGRQILIVKNIHSADVIDLSKFSQGIYFIKVYNNQLKINRTIKIFREN